MSYFKVARTKYTFYKNTIGYCSNPKCKSIFNLEAHHIIPYSYDKLEDNVGNIVVLCVECHDKLGVHKNFFGESMDLLFRWKYTAEMEKLGFIVNSGSIRWFITKITNMKRIRIRENIKKLKENNKKDTDHR